MLKFLQLGLAPVVQVTNGYTLRKLHVMHLSKIAFTGSTANGNTQSGSAPSHTHGSMNRMP
ncbi:hypothetical protein E2C01_019544 [Portunus trituberculatus]|uniref:Uncharacterized protein n=1 Tax=Portunus trituberculatus TaxID=210409 RepID=A0A5B7DYK1_PORTR|nr:hypothetical protein [Portunus trituberculatus]